MPFRSIVAEPDEIARMQTAVDEAWASIQLLKAVDPLSAGAERERLAYIVVGLWKQDPEQDLAATAVERFMATAAKLTVV